MTRAFHHDDFDPPPLPPVLFITATFTFYNYNLRSPFLSTWPDSIWSRLESTRSHWEVYASLGNVWKKRNRWSTFLGTRNNVDGDRGGPPPPSPPFPLLLLFFSWKKGIGDKGRNPGCESVNRCMEMVKGIEWVSENDWMTHTLHYSNLAWSNLIHLQPTRFHWSL